MTLTFRFVGFIIDKKYRELKFSYEGKINLVTIHNLFISWGLIQEEVNKIKFIIDSEHIEDSTKFYTINSNEEYIIFVFIENQDIKEKIRMILNNEHTTSEDSEDTEDEEINQPITQENDQLPILTPDIIHKMNETTLLLLSDPDFINLLSIYKRKPELFNSLSNYIQTNDIITESLLVEKNINEFSEKDSKYYNDLSIKIMNLQLGVPKNVIIDKLIKYSGHLNLTIRSIFNDMS